MLPLPQHPLDVLLGRQERATERGRQEQALLGAWCAEAQSSHQWVGD